jgi:hypothetical protein
MTRQTMALNPMTELGPSNPIYPFMLLSEYQVLICQKCQHACLATEATTHLAKKHHRIDPGTRRRLVEDAKMVPNVLRIRVDLSQLQYPPPSSKPLASPHQYLIYANADNAA